MKGNYNGIDFEWFSQEYEGQYAALYQLIFHNEKHTYVIRKSVGKTFATPKEAEIRAMEMAKHQIEQGHF